MRTEVILTKYLAADCLSDARITARFAMWSDWVKIPFPYRIKDQEQRYRLAAYALIDKAGLDLTIVAGGLTKEGMAFVAEYRDKRET